MSVHPVDDVNQRMPGPRGHAVGFAETQSQCDAIIDGLNIAGFPHSRIAVLAGDDGIHLLKRMFAGTLWGETAEEMLKQGVIELSRGRIALVVEAKDREEALLASNIAKKKGGHGFCHFGTFIDTRLTE